MSVVLNIRRLHGLQILSNLLGALTPSDTAVAAGSPPGEAVDRMRRREHKQLKGEGDDRLTGTKCDWPRNPADLKGEQRREFAQLRQNELKTTRAWALKETAMAFYSYVCPGPARKHFHWWYKW